MPYKPVRTTNRISTGGGTTVIIEGGDVDQTITIGEDDQEFQEINGTLDGQDLGSQDHSHASDEHLGTATLPAGTDDQAFDTFNQTGDGEKELGTDDQEFQEVLGTLDGQNFGDHEHELEANASGPARANPTGTRVDIGAGGGSTTWSNPTNAELESSGNAVITDTGETLAAVSFSDELRLSFGAIPAIPTDWTATQYDLVIINSWETLNPTLDLLSTSTFWLIMRYTDGTEDFLKTMTQATANQASLLTETYDISTRVITEGKTPERLMCQAVADIAITQTGTTKTWTVDVGRIEVTIENNSIV